MALLEPLKGKLYLSQVSPRDKKLCQRKLEADAVAEMHRDSEYHSYVDRIHKCAGALIFVLMTSGLTGEIALKLREGWFCRVRHCPICCWRKSLMWRARFIKMLPQVVEEYPNSQFIFLTLSPKTCPVENLRETLDLMTEAWKRLINRKQWCVQGYVRSREITRRPDGYCHPHFHCVLMVPPSYFGGNYYLSQAAWTDLWQSCLKVDYKPVVHVKKIKELKTDKPLPSALADNETMASLTPMQQSLVNAVGYTLKYSFKAEDILKISGDKSKQNKKAKSANDNSEKPVILQSDIDYLLELTKQVHKTRAIMTGGVFKQYLKELEDERALQNDDLIHINDSDSTGDEPLEKTPAFWRALVGDYELPEMESLVTA